MLPWCPGRPPWCPRCSGALVLWPRAGFLVTWSCGALVFCYLGFFTPRKGTRQGGRLHEPQGTRLPGHKEQQGTRGRDQAARTPAYQPSRVPGQLPGTRVLGGQGARGQDQGTILQETRDDQSPKRPGSPGPPEFVYRDPGSRGNWQLAASHASHESQA